MLELDAVTARYRCLAPTLDERGKRLFAAAEAKTLGYGGVSALSRRIVADVLHSLNFSLQGNRKTKEGDDHPDRDKQFRHINGQVKAFLVDAQPVISVDTKKKELIGEYGNNGREWRAKGSPVDVNGHDFPDPGVPRAHPYGVYDLARNKGFVNVGTDHDTATFAVASIRRWWMLEGRRVYPKAKRLLITADGGGSNGSRLRLWKWELQRLSDELMLPISVCHFPPGTSKWNKVEHRLFSFISINWRGKPLVSYETVVKLISHTTTAQGLSAMCKLDKRRYKPGRKIDDKAMSRLSIQRATFHGEWNYTMSPRLLLANIIS